MKKYVITIIIIVGILLALFGSFYIYSSNNSQNSIETLKAKADEEIIYLNTTIISMMNKLNNISYANYKIVEQEVTAEEQEQQSSSASTDQANGGGQAGGSGGEETSKSGSNTITNMNMNFSSILVNPNKKVDWTEIKKETEKMYQTWPTILIDLNALNINKDNLLKFNSVLDNVTKAVQKEDKKVSLAELGNLYSLIVSYTKEYSNDTKKVNLLQTKSYVLYAYALCEDEKWQDMQKYLKEAQGVYNSIMNSGVESANNVAHMNKGYILLNELEKSTNTKDKSIFYINYKNFMQEIATMEK